MLLTLLNIVLPVFIIAALGFWFGRRQTVKPQMAFINQANVLVFCPALVFSALINNPISLLEGWPLIAGGALIIIIPGLLLALIPKQGLHWPGFVVPGMIRNTGNIGIPLLMLAYGKDLLGDIIVLFVISNILTFSLGIFLLSSGQSRWAWLKNPNVWAAVLGVLLAPVVQQIPAFVHTSVDLLGQIAIPLMLFSLGVRLSQDKIENVGLAFRINCLYLLAGLITVVIVVWALPLTQDWTRLLVLSAMLPPAVINFLLCEQYRVEPRAVASVVLLGNAMSIITIPLVVWVTLTYL